MIPESVQRVQEDKASRKTDFTVDSSFDSDEDTLAAWKAVAVFGGLLVAEWWVSVYGIAPGAWSEALAVSFAGAGFFALLAVLPLALWGYTELALACVGAAGVGFSIGAFVSLWGPNTLLVTAVLPVGVIAAAMGISRWAMLARKLSIEDGASPS